jgi:hypothetical protein
MAKKNLSQPNPNPEPKAKYDYGLTKSQFATIRNIADALHGLTYGLCDPDEFEHELRVFSGMSGEAEMAPGRVANAIENQKLGGAQ